MRSMIILIVMLSLGGSLQLVQQGYPGDMLNFDGSFPINYTEYGVKRPQFLMLKLAEVVRISLNFTATTGR